MHFGVQNPTGLTFERHPTEPDTLVLTASAGGDQLTIIASRRRFEQALLNPRASRGEIARGMYERGEIDVEAFEAELGSSLGR